MDEVRKSMLLEKSKVSKNIMKRKNSEFMEEVGQDELFKNSALYWNNVKNQNTLKSMAILI